MQPGERRTKGGCCVKYPDECSSADNSGLKCACVFLVCVQFASRSVPHGSVAVNSIALEFTSGPKEHLV